MTFKKPDKQFEQSGVSLIEVLVVLVLLTVGILSVIRLFPPGFLINKQTAEATVAARLSKQEMDRFANGSSNLMDAIVPVIPITSGSGYVFGVDNNATPDDMTEADAAVYGVFAPYFSDVNKVRRILGEWVRIPQPTSTTLGRGSVYMLSSGPFMDISWDGKNRSIFISGAPLIRRQPDSGLGVGIPRPAPSGFLGRSSYAVDYNNKDLAFAPAAYDRQFLLNISYYNTAGLLTPLIDIPIDVPANVDDWVPIPSGSLPIDFQSLAAFTDNCSRKFKEIAPGTPWAANDPARQDPYEFYLDPANSPRLGAANSVGANVGVVVFSPLGRNYNEETAAGRQPLTARIDYDVLDWHIIREDRPLPASSPYEVALSLHDLKKLGDFEDDQTAYQDLFAGITRPSSGLYSAPVDFMVYNASTGTYVPAVDPNTNAINYAVNYKDGSVIFSDAFGASNASATLRLFYRAHGDWALQIQKASSVYRQHFSGDGRPSFSEFYLGGWSGGGGDPTRIYFPLSEAGKTVSIREIWYQNTGGQKPRVANESYRINANRTLFQNPSGNQILTWIDIRDKHADATGFDTSSYGYAINGVQGISFRTRVLWRNGSTVTATSNGNSVRTRWRRADLDTILTRSAQQR